MSNYTLDQKTGSATMAAVNTTTNVQRKSHTSIPKGSIMERLMDFAFSIPDFRRTGKGNHRHELGDIIMLAHGRIETRTYNVYDGLELIADRDKWGGNLTVV